MPHSQPAPRTIYRAPRRGLRAVALLAVVALAAALGHQSLAPSQSAATSPLEVLRGEHRDRGAPGAVPEAVPDAPRPFDEDDPGVANLDPELLGALRRAATDAGHDDVRIRIDSGWRSPEEQERLLREAIAKYGSEAEAARWVASPTRSAHVSGDAVDVGPDGARAWLSAHGARYGLCQTYANEPWHFELRAEAPGQGCPAMYADATHDPRMHR